MGQPLDPAKAFFYGQFVQAAYTMFRNQNADPLRPEPAGIPEGYELGAWIHMSDFFLNLEKPEFYGIVVRCIEDPDSRIIAIRGTESKLEWLDDAFALLTPFRQVPDAGKVARGFDRIYSSLKVVKRPLPGDRALAAAAPEAAVPLETFSGSFAEQLEQLAISREAARGVAPSAAEGRGRPQRPTVVTGHSLGSALTTLFVLENADKHKFDISTCAHLLLRVLATGSSREYLMGCPSIRGGSLIRTTKCPSFPSVFLCLIINTSILPARSPPRASRSATWCAATPWRPICTGWTRVRRCGRSAL